MKVYRRSYKAAKAIYEMTVGFPNEERYGITNEVLVLIDFSKDVGYISDEKHRKAFAEYEEIASMLNLFIQSVKTKV